MTDIAMPIEATTPTPTGPDGLRDLPLYEQLKARIKARIEAGDWPANHRVPSENELVEALGVSRMTANRALRELATEGVILRIQGKGSFVAPAKRSAPFLGVRNIADEIAERGAVHTAVITLSQAENCGPELADALEVAMGAQVFHTVIVHREDDVPIQIEDRFVNPAVAPDYLAQDFHGTTPNAYLTALAPIARTEQSVEAILPKAWECRLLSIARTEPCLMVRRRTWSVAQRAEARVVTSVRLLYPGTRYRLESAY
ncbi:hypothetical protein GCM10011505_01300 [Tistrella bauzanensis]|uniref:Histidine utilization repressor n=2 Tax=Tistrella bauzanensis TaxID=657419 RepID=A0ABQ1I8S5_9PROT|nr:hypothetical protein GCM10011505_01300 [Tistrella bauzanensis]